ncbi:MAG: LCP family protein, partial [Bacilli bacterium]
MRSERKRAKRRGKIRWKNVLLLIVMAGLAIGLYFGVNAVLDIKKIFTGDEGGDHSRIDNAEPLTVLLAGVDEREDDIGRADTLIVATVNPKTKSTKMLSIPRDLYVTYTGFDHTGKINESYSRSGLPTTIATVSDWIDMPIDYYVKINMDGLISLMDAVGGVEVDNPFAWSDKGFDYPEGRIHLEGRRGLWYVRMRYEDPEGDLGRQKRQQMVIKALADKLMSPAIVTDLPDILRSLSDNVETDVPFSRVPKLAT